MRQTQPCKDRGEEHFYTADGKGNGPAGAGRLHECEIRPAQRNEAATGYEQLQNWERANGAQPFSAVPSGARRAKQPVSRWSQERQPRHEDQEHR